MHRLRGEPDLMVVVVQVLGKAILGYPVSFGTHLLLSVPSVLRSTSRHSSRVIQ